MQNWVLKNIKTFLFILIATSSGAQTYTFRFKNADSLFAAKQYTQSFEHYETVLLNQEYSPAMLLKMAFIQEGLGHVGKALYYLNLYQQVTHDPEVEAKMGELATKYNLQGYDMNDAERVLTKYERFRPYVTAVLVAVCVLLFAVAFYQRMRKHQRPIAWVVVLTFFLIVLFLHVRFGGDVSAGVIAHGNTFLMHDPSSGSDVVEVIGDGHRIEIIGKHDVWLKVIWNGSVAYVKDNAVLPLSL